jgi:hypothetical protein
MRAAETGSSRSPSPNNQSWGVVETAGSGDVESDPPRCCDVGGGSDLVTLERHCHAAADEGGGTV